ncbi:hypothetical protein BDQ94DRAFT_140184 [Aspergillus welwitschiae]|uniref:Major facilitator superfamily (MFS) profile domain-containing protein n=1 Tax=Aspergillus welwitschiae TaxID=1341132 RepID=A0A3F3Q7Q5_9EURO|nr:hypothetical protein BDQ94DRAFT_140184 [Aspergillus welwitschiae]RDH35077.1 hypothetical protein BDQ94DRAFT_140184 [Aspergillus welwitschiae]
MKYMISFGATCTALPWTYKIAVVPILARGRGTALSVCIDWVVNVWLRLFMPEALNKTAWKIIFCFWGCLHCNFYCYCFVSSRDCVAVA